MTGAGPEPWVLATHNPGKVSEFQALLAGSSFQLRSLSEFAITPPVESGLTFVENALIKARHAASVTGLRAIADDSGLAVEALLGAPGVNSARFAAPNATAEENIDHLLEELSNVDAEKRRARFHCVIVALASAQDPAPLVAHGVWKGQIAMARRGDGGFGYDSIFVTTESGLTAAELPSATKNRLSHRGQALKSLRHQLEIRES